MAKLDSELWQGAVSHAEDMVEIALSSLALTPEQAIKLQLLKADSKDGLPDTVFIAVEEELQPSATLTQVIDKLATTVAETYRWWLGTKTKGMESAGLESSQIEKLLPAIKKIAEVAIADMAYKEPKTASAQEWRIYWNDR